MLVDVHSGFAPPEWQSYVGPILAYRPQYHHILGTQIEGQSDVQHFNSLDVEIIWTFMSTIMISLEKTKIPKADRDPVRDLRSVWRRRNTSGELGLHI